jgi:hypothetical protein
VEVVDDAVVVEPADEDESGGAYGISAKDKPAPAPMPRRRKPARDEDDDEDEDEPVSRRSRTRRRSRYDEDDDDYEEDDDYDRRRRSRRKRRGASTSARWQRGRIGLLIAFIAACILGGGVGIEDLIRLIWSVITIESLSTLEALVTFANVAKLVEFIAALVFIVGYVFCLLVPNRNGTLGLAIASLSVGGVALIFKIQYNLLPVFKTSLWGRGGGGLFGELFFDGRGGFTSVLITHMIALMVMEAEIIVFALFLRAVSLSFRDDQGARNALIVVTLASVHAGLQFLLHMIIYIVAESATPGQPMSPSASKAIYYLLQTISWGAVAVQLAELVLYALTIFGTRTLIEPDDR